MLQLMFENTKRAVVTAVPSVVLGKEDMPSVISNAFGVAGSVFAGNEGRKAANRVQTPSEPQWLGANQRLPTTEEAAPIANIKAKANVKSERKATPKVTPKQGKTVEAKSVNHTNKKEVTVTRATAKNKSWGEELLDVLIPAAYADEIKPNDTTPKITSIAKDNLEASFGQKIAIGSGKAVVNTGQGIKQLGLTIGEKLGVVDKGATEQYTNMINQEKDLYDSTPVGQSFVAKGAEIATDIFIAVAAPLGAGVRGSKFVASSAFTGASWGGLRATEDGNLSSRAGNAAIGAVEGMVGAKVVGVVTSKVGKIITNFYDTKKVQSSLGANLFKGKSFEQIGFKLESKGFTSKYAQGNSVSAARSQGTSYQAAQLKIDLQKQTCRSLFTTEGKLTKVAIDNSKILQRVKDFDQRAPIFKELSQRGNIDDWYKYQTQKFNTPGVDIGLKQTNPLAEVHFYKNAKTREVYYDMDFKVKIDIAGQPQITVQEFLNSLPKKWRPTF
jgi:hypothetical protein